MRFAPTDDQVAFRDAVADLLGAQCTPAHVRGWWDDPVARPEDSPVWRHLADMGVVACTAPEAADGLGFALADLEPLLEEAGRAALPEPLVETTAVAVPLLARHGADTADVVHSWLARIAAGDVGVAVALDGGAPVVGAGTAGLLVAVDGDGRIVLVPGEAVTAAPQASVDGARHLATPSWASGDATVLAEGDRAARLVAAARRRGAVATAAVLLGLADRMLELTVGYVSERRQFGVPVGSFQAVKHHLADAALALEFAKPVVRAAAATLSGVLGADDAERGPAADPEVAASMAKAQASEAASVVAATALQCHGAIGYTVEYDLHLYLKRTWALAEAWGSAAWHREQIARQLLDVPAG